MSRPLFTVLPATMTSLADVVRHMGAVSAKPLPPVEDIGRRLRRAYAVAALDGYCSVRSLHLLPYAYWVEGEAPLPQIHPHLVTHYWSAGLPSALRGTSRQAKRWLRSLFDTYCAFFKVGDAAFDRFAESLVASLTNTDKDMPEKLQDLHRRFSFFRPMHAPTAVARYLFMNADAPTLAASRSELLFGPGFSGVALGGAVLREVLRQPQEVRQQEDTIQRLMEWVEDLPGGVAVSTEWRVEFAEALLEPWAKAQPPEKLQKAIMEFFLEHYGDPSVPQDPRYKWRGISEQAQTVMQKWLAGKTLNVFMNVLERTADQIWRYRQKLWMACYEKGLLQDAWVVLGDDASFDMTSFRSAGKNFQFGRLDGASDRRQSVLLMRIGDLLLVEWSHNGSLRAYAVDTPNIPELRQKRYDATQLRSVRSLDFHHGENANPELRHMSSEYGTWQRKARDFLRYHTGEHLSDEEILL